MSRSGDRATKAIRQTKDRPRRARLLLAVVWWGLARPAVVKAAAARRLRPRPRIATPRLLCAAQLSGSSSRAFFAAASAASQFRQAMAPTLRATHASGAFGASDTACLE